MQAYNPEEALLKVRREFGEHGGVTPSLARSSTFTVMDPATLPEIFAGKKGPEKGGFFLYSRSFNPTVDVLSRYLAAMESTEAAICTSSGMSAISCTLMQMCKVGDHIVASDSIYGGTHALLQSLLPELGIEATFVNISDREAVTGAIQANTRVIYTEVFGNPTLRVADLAALSELSKANGLKLVVDNTFSPVMVSPANLGADVVVYSLTKFVNGASDLIAGAICGDKAFVQELMDLHTGRIMLLGPTMDPRVAFDLIQRLPHLPLRMREHGRRAMAMAELLEQMNVQVFYPGLTSHPQHLLASSMINEGYGFGGILAVDCATVAKAEDLMDVLQNEENFGFMAVSLGYFDTLMSCSSSSTSSEISTAEQEKMGLSPGLLRISVGLTGSLEQRLGQLKRGVEKVLKT